VQAAPHAAAEMLQFAVGGAHYALPAAMVAEIIRPRALTRVPHAHASLVGVLNLRGIVLPVLSLASLLGRDAAAAAPGARVVVLDRGAPVGLLVESVTALAAANGVPVVDIEALLARDFSALARRPQGQREAAAGPAAEAAPMQRGLAMLGVKLAGQEYALPLSEVAEVMALPADIGVVPRTDAAMLGVAALRGRLLPLVSLRVLLGLPADGFDRGRARIVVTHAGGIVVGLVVDAMTAILRVPESDMDKVPRVLTRGRGEAQIETICRLDGGRRLVAVLAPARIFDSATAARIQAGAAEESGLMPTEDAAEGSFAAEQFVVFQLGGESYGLPIQAVEEVVRRPDQLTRIAQAPGFIDGVMNLRGQVIPVIDQRRRFAVPAAERGSGRRVVVVAIDGLRAGFVVDAISEVISIPLTELQTAPALAADGSTIFDRIATIERDGRMILLVDAKALLNRAERDTLAALSRTEEAAGSAAAS
jgi:purine-binding chemotaxis protein CheW